MKRKLTTLLLTFVFSAICAAVMSAQTPLKLSGEVVDESGYPLAGVVVMADGSSVAAVSDADGKFVINAPAGTKSLTFTCLGMNDEKVQIGTKTYFSIIMSTDKISLQETVVIGYGTMSKHDLSTSVASVKSEALTERASSFNVLQGLAGKVVVTGGDGELAAAKRIMAGTQSMTIFKDSKMIAGAGVEALDAFLKGEEPAYNGELDNGTAKIPAVLVDMIVVTQDNIQEIFIDGGVFTEAELKG